MNNAEARQPLTGREDLDAIAGWIKPAASVLDLGCGDGLLLRHLRQSRDVRGYGIEIADENVIASVRNGVNVIQSDLESGLSGIDAHSFDYVILSQTLQTVRQTEQILQEMLRVGREAIVTFPNMGFWSHRLQIMLGRMPISKSLPYQWFDTPNVHLCTIRDFEAFCSSHGIRVLERIVMHGGRRINAMPNLRGSLAVFRFEKASG
ncbi:MAG: methionine biosynthesis protein MetW [Burkholderiales bacterium]